QPMRRARRRGGATAAPAGVTEAAAMPIPASMRRLLRLRESLERQEEMELAFAAARLRDAEACATTAHAAEQKAQTALRHELEQTVSGAELQAAQFSQQAGEQREQILGAQLAQRALERDT